jgi:hypothetical protein
MTAYCLHQIKKHTKRDIDIIVVSNSAEEGIEHFKQYDCTLLKYPTRLMQSHGIAFDFAMSYVNTEYFITLESDSFPTQDSWLEYYDNIIKQGYDMAGSRLQLSGGEYIHPAGAIYKKSNYELALNEVKKINARYKYYPNLGMKDGASCHIMSIGTMSDFKDKHHSYNNLSFAAKLQKYKPCAKSVFHNGMGFKQESINTYGQRTIQSEKDFILMPEISDDIIYRMGYEPGQWFAYWHYANNKRVFEIPTTIKWMDNRVNQQQEFTLTENGLKHLWGITAYNLSDYNKDIEDILIFKKKQMEDLP